MKKRLLSKVKGSAMVEFAIMSTVLIPILLYSQYFSEAIHIQMKVDEASYFVAWEFTGYQLTDYRTGNHAGMFNSARSRIQTMAGNLYANYDSADIAYDNGDDETSATKFLMITPGTINLTVEARAVSLLPNPEEADSDELGEPEDDSGGFFDSALSMINSGLQAILQDWFNFNLSNAGVMSQASVSYGATDYFKTKKEYMKDGKGGWYNIDLTPEGLADDGQFTYQTQPFTVWVDGWRLEDGSDVNSQHSPGDKAFVRQVQNMLWMGVISNIPLLEDIDGLLLDKLNLGGIVDSPIRAHVASVNYKQAALSGQPYNKTVDGGQRGFHTTPMWYIATHTATRYSKTLESRKDFYMGNDKEQCNIVDLDCNRDIEDIPED